MIKVSSASVNQISLKHMASDYMQGVGPTVGFSGVTISPSTGDIILLEDNVSYLMLEDNISELLLEA